MARRNPKNFKYIDGSIKSINVQDINNSLAFFNGRIATIEALQQSGTALELVEVAGNTFAYENGKIWKWIVTGDSTLSITGLGSDPVVGIVIATQSDGGEHVITLPGVSDDVSFRTADGDVNILGFLWDGVTLYWDSSFKGGSGVSSAYEKESEAFFAVNTALNDPQKLAVDTLVKRLKAIGWGKFKAVYPFIGGTADTHKWNLVDPRDLDAAYRLVFNGGWTHTANGSAANGTTGYANTFFDLGATIIENPPTLTDLADWKSFCVTYYSRTNSVQGAGDYNYFGTARSSYIVQFENFNNSGFYFVPGKVDGAVTVGSGETVFNGLVALNRQSASLAKGYVKMKQIGSDITTALDVGISTPTPLYINAKNNAGTATEFSNHQCAFFTIGSGLTDGELNDLNSAIVEYQTALSRNV